MKIFPDFFDGHPDPPIFIVQVVCRLARSAFSPDLKWLRFAHRSRDRLGAQFLPSLPGIFFRSDHYAWMPSLR
jgi:hypothetical protein